MPAYRSESVLTLWKAAGVPRENNHSEFARNRQTKTDIAVVMGGTLAQIFLSLKRT